MSSSDDDPRGLTLDDLVAVPEIQREPGSDRGPGLSGRPSEANPFRDVPTMPSQRIRADTLVNEPVVEVGPASDEPEAQALREALACHGADLSKVAAELDISVREIYQQAARFGVRISDYT